MLHKQGGQPPSILTATALPTVGIHARFRQVFDRRPMRSYSG